MRSPLLPFALVWALACVALAATAQDTAFERIEVQVTASSGNLLVIDHGSLSGLAEGDLARFFPAGAPLLQGVLRAVVPDSATVELSGAPGEVELGTPGEVLVPRERLQPAETPAPIVEHPPWEAPPEAWEAEQPLLAPAQGRSRAERPPRITGRTFLHSDLIWDRGEAESQYLLARGGLDLRWENPYGSGGEAFLAGEVFHRTADFVGESEAETFFRPRRLSYAWGGARESSNRFEVGRFFHREFPEFGLLDGFEFAHRTEGNDRLGFSLGYLPEPTDELRTGKDLETGIFFRAVMGAEEELSLGAGYQKTWHEGEADRDLVVTSLRWSQSRSFFLSASTWVDYYTSADDLKSPGFELTQALLNASWRTAGGSGLGLHAGLLRWPQLLRNEFAALPAEKIQDGEVERVGLDATSRLSQRTRLSGRADLWRDEEDSGTSGDLRLGLRDVLFERGDVTFSVYTNQGKFSSALGTRIDVAKRFERGQLVLGLDLASVQEDPAFSPGQDLLQGALRAGWDTSLGRDYDLSLFLEERFGDEQESTALGFLIQHRFGRK